MSVADAVQRGRVFAVAQMVDTFTAYKPTAGKSGNFDVTTYVDQGTTLGKVGGSSGGDPVTRTLTIGDSRVPIIEGGLQIPLDAFVVNGAIQIVSSEQRGTAWEFECTAVGPATDPALLGRRFMVVNLPVKSNATARRMDVVEVSAP